VEHQRDSSKFNVFCAISSQQVHGPFFFAEETVTGWHGISGHIATVTDATAAKHTDVHIPARRKTPPPLPI